LHFTKFCIAIFCVKFDIKILRNVEFDIKFCKRRIQHLEKFCVIFDIQFCECRIAYSDKGMLSTVDLFF
jgi:hypothetical protein